MTSSDQPTAASGEGQERPEGVIFLGESQWVLGNPPPPGGPLTTVLAVPPLRSTRAGSFSSYKKGRQSFQGGSSIGDLIRSVIHFINRCGRTKDRLGDLKQKQRQLIDKPQDLLAPPPPSGGNGHGPAFDPPTPPADRAQGANDPGTNGLQPQQPAEPQASQPLPHPEDQATGANDHG